MLKQLTVLTLVCSVPVSTLKKNALEHKDLQTIAEKQLHGTFQPFIELFLLLTVLTLRNKDRALWPCTAAHSPSCHIQWLSIPNSRWKGGKLGALQAGNVNIKLRFLCSCLHVGGEEPLWGCFRVCLCAWEAVRFLKGDAFCCFAVVDVLLLTWSLQFGSLRLGGAALDQIFPLIRVEIKMNSAPTECPASPGSQERASLPTFLPR